MAATLKEMSGNDDASINDGDFDQVFAEFDKNGDGTVSKDEMAAFIK